MSANPDTDEIVSYLSTRFNKIFCDRDFVCCVSADFRALLATDHAAAKCCVLVFPVLGPIYQKAIRYQAKIYDLAAFGLTTNKHKSVAVCHKRHLLKITMEVKDEVVSRRKRPERQLYVPPAQRTSRLSRTEDCNKPPKTDTQTEPELLICPSLEAFVDLQISTFGLLWCHQVYLKDYAPGSTHNFCPFNNYNRFGNKTQTKWTIPLYTTRYLHKLCVLECDQVLWRPALPQYSASAKKRYPVHANCDAIKCATITRPSVLYSECNIVPECNSSQFELVQIDSDTTNSDLYVLDLTEHNLPHFLMFKHSDCDYCFVCDQQHTMEECYADCTGKLSKPTIAIDKVLEISKVSIKNTINDKQMTKTMSKKHEHDQEKEIMRKTKENINRKSKPIMKYVEDNNDTLKIDKGDNINNWEDLFDDEGHLQDELFSEIKQKVGGNVTIVKANEDYTAYATKPIEEFEHIVELYNFPANLETHDIIQIFSELKSDSMYVKWVDDTHALLVLGSSIQAQRAVELNNPLIKARPMSAASGVSIAVANKSDLKPAMKRPPTNLQTARRLITTHLGAKTRISREQSAKEREDLKAARELRRLTKQSERDAWDGFSKTNQNV